MNIIITYDILTCMMEFVLTFLLDISLVFSN